MSRAAGPDYMAIHHSKVMMSPQSTVERASPVTMPRIAVSGDGSQRRKLARSMSI